MVWRWPPSACGRDTTMAAGRARAGAGGRVAQPLAAHVSTRLRSANGPAPMPPRPCRELADGHDGVQSAALTLAGLYTLRADVRSGNGTAASQSRRLRDRSSGGRWPLARRACGGPDVSSAIVRRTSRADAVYGLRGARSESPRWGAERTRRQRRRPIGGDAARPGPATRQFVARIAGRIFGPHQASVPARSATP